MHPSDDVGLRPIPKLPANSGEAIFYPLGATAWQPGGIYAESERLMDGVHVTAPAFTGPAVLVVLFAGAPVWSALSCPGFAICMGQAASTLGPFFVTGVP